MATHTQAFIYDIAMLLEVYGLRCVGEKAPIQSLVDHAIKAGNEIKLT